MILYSAKLKKIQFIVTKYKSQKNQVRCCKRRKVLYIVKYNFQNEKNRDIFYKFQEKKWLKQIMMTL